MFLFGLIDDIVTELFGGALLTHPEVLEFLGLSHAEVTAVEFVDERLQSPIENGQLFEHEIAAFPVILHDILRTLAVSTAGVSSSTNSSGSRGRMAAAMLLP